MKCTECRVRLNDYCDGTLAPAEALAVQGHLAGCDACRREHAAVANLLQQARRLPRGIPTSHDGWLALQAAVAAGPAVVETFDARRRRRATDLHRGWRWLPPLAMAASLALLMTFAERTQRAAAPAAAKGAWTVAALAGAPRVAQQRVRGESAFRVGQWLETDAHSRAKVTVGGEGAVIGEVDVEPNSRMRLAGVATTDHRLELAQGKMRALIWAPPRIFFVDTPSATAVDLGCAYTLEVDDQGNGELQVLTGYVALEQGDREAIIPSGLMCLTRRGAGPGTPFTPDAPPALRSALERFDFEAGAGAAALPIILQHARADDAITLWHLLSRTADDHRARVYDALAKLSAPPAGVTRAGILANNRDMRRAWAAELGLGSFPTK